MHAYDYLDVDGISRCRHDASGNLLGSDDEEIAEFWRDFGSSKSVDEKGRPVPFFHGTAASFDEFSATHHRSVLNEKYQGDAFHFSPELDVATRYAFASRNQFFNKDRIYSALEKAIPLDLVAVFKSVVEAGYRQAWDIPQSEVSAIFDSATRAGIDLNDLLDLASFVEGNNVDAGRPGYFDAGMIFGNSVSSFPDWARVSAQQFGIGELAPAPRVVMSYLKCQRPLRTNSRDLARSAQQMGYDSVIFEGQDLVSGVPEWAVFSPEQIVMRSSLDNLHEDEPAWRAANRVQKRARMAP